MQTIALWTLVGVLDDDHVLALRAADAELGAGRRGVLEQALLELGIGPRARHDARTVVGADLPLVELGDPVDRLLGHHALLDHQRLECFHARGDLGVRGRKRAGDGGGDPVCGVVVIATSSRGLEVRFP